jgi:hypothetical protein
VQERAGDTPEQIGIGNEFLNRIQMAPQLRERIDKWDCMKLKSFCTTQWSPDPKEAVHRMGENLCQLFISQRLITRIYRDSEN